MKLKYLLLPTLVLALPACDWREQVIVKSAESPKEFNAEEIKTNLVQTAISDFFAHESIGGVWKPDENDILKSDVIELVEATIKSCDAFILLPTTTKGNYTLEALKSSKPANLIEFKDFIKCSELTILQQPTPASWSNGLSINSLYTTLKETPEMSVLLRKAYDDSTLTIKELKSILVLMNQNKPPETKATP